MSNGPWILELAARKSWAEMRPRERAIFDKWLKEKVDGRDLYLLIRHALTHQDRADMTTLDVVSAIPLVRDKDSDAGNSG